MDTQDAQDADDGNIFKAAHKKIDIEMIKNHRQKYGLSAASEVIAQQSKAIADQYKDMAESDNRENEMAKSRSISRKQSIRLTNNKLNASRESFDNQPNPLQQQRSSKVNADNKLEQIDEMQFDETGLENGESVDLGFLD